MSSRELTMRFNTKATKKDGKVGCKIEPSALATVNRVNRVS
jgi:hypothetical protein